MARRWSSVRYVADMRCGMPLTPAPHMRVTHRCAAAEGSAGEDGFFSTHNEGGRCLHTRSYTCSPLSRPWSGCLPHMAPMRGDWALGKSTNGCGYHSARRAGSSRVGLPCLGGALLGYAARARPRPRSSGSDLQVVAINIARQAVVMMNCTINPPTPCLWQAPASTQKTKKENQAGHSSERAVEGQRAEGGPAPARCAQRVCDRPGRSRCRPATTEKGCLYHALC